MLSWVWNLFIVKYASGWTSCILKYNKSKFNNQIQLEDLDYFDLIAQLPLEFL